MGSWPDTGMMPKMTAKTADDLIDWCYSAVTFKAIQGRRVVVFGHDSMGMETALAHVIPTRNTFGLEITRLDMKLLADMLQKKAYCKNELKELRAWIDKMMGKRVEIKTPKQEELFTQSLAMYLISRDIMKDLNAVRIKARKHHYRTLRKRICRDCLRCCSLLTLPVVPRHYLWTSARFGSHGKLRNWPRN